MQHSRELVNSSENHAQNCAFFEETCAVMGFEPPKENDIRFLLQIIA